MDIVSYEAKARQYQQKGQWQDALELYQLAIAEDPNNSHLHSLAGDTLLNLQRWEEAVASYRKSLSLETNFDWAWHNLAFVLGQLGKWEEVRECHDALARVKPDFWDINGSVPLVQKHLSAYNVYINKTEHNFQSAAPTKETTHDNSSEQKSSEEDKALERIVRLSDHIYLAMFTWATGISEDTITLNIESAQPCKAVYWTTCELGKVVGSFLFSDIADISTLKLLVTAQESVQETGDSTFQDSGSEVYRLGQRTEMIQGVNDLILEVGDLGRWRLFQNVGRYQNKYRDFSLSFVHYDLFNAIKAKVTEESTLKLDYGCWLAPNVVYFEASVEDIWTLDWFDVAVTSSQFFRVVKSYSFQISDSKLASIVVFSENAYKEDFQQFSFTFFNAEQRISLSSPIHKKGYSLECIEHINKKSESKRSLIKESVNYGLICCAQNNIDNHSAAALVSKFQRYVSISDHNPLNDTLPFQMFFDQVIPISHNGFFLIGWIHDPFESLEGIEIITDLGFRYELSPKEIYRFERKDVVEHLKSTKYGSFPSKPGFCTYAKANLEIQSKVAPIANFHGVRFNIKLSSGVSVDVLPKVKFYDGSTARKVVTTVVGADQLTDEMLDVCIGPAASRLQELCIGKVSIEEVLEIGNLPTDPDLSIIIPIYQRYDFQKVQIALFANDKFLKENVEIIYVLDSPWQKFEFSTFMQQHCKLYELPAKVVFMKHNSGYSSANNAGAKHASGKHLLLMNSDVFPCEQGWAAKMLNFYNSSEKIGTVGGKLIYEDGSLQHAGMFFGKTTYPFWQNLHYYKGFPNAYPPAQKIRQVPAVTGACLMISRNLYEAVGGLSVDYVIGDFEDSDLCLKCVEQGYENWYYPEAEFYHLERQSVPLNPSYAGSLVWHYNAKLHSQKWDWIISRLMKEHPG